MKARSFTGERLHEGDARFALDLARHQAAYEFAARRLPAGHTLDLGSGSGYGSTRLAGDQRSVVGVDRVAPDAAQRRGAARFVRADLRALPFRPGSFAAVASFQVIEHLEEPAPYLESIARLLGDGGVAILTTPNVGMSDGVNPYHVHEYEAEELAALLARHFREVEVEGVGMSEAVRGHMAARSARIQRILRLDPLRLRERLPRAWIEHAFAAFALWVRARAGTTEGNPDASWEDFPVGARASESIDLLAICSGPMRGSEPAPGAETDPAAARAASHVG